MASHGALWSHLFICGCGFGVSAPGGHKIPEGHGPGCSPSALPSPEPSSGFSTNIVCINVCMPGSGAGGSKRSRISGGMGRSKVTTSPSTTLRNRIFFPKSRVYIHFPSLCLEVTVLCYGTVSTVSTHHQGTRSSILFVLLGPGGPSS